MPRPTSGPFVKATPDKLCAAVSNYGELCTAYAAGGAGEYGAPEGGAALPVPRSGVAGVEELRKRESVIVKSERTRTKAAGAWSACRGSHVSRRY